ncbi:MAG: B12-binding domain-containing radical SAM protein [Elusimicrobiota bacterium]
MARKILLIYPPAFWSAYRYGPSFFLVKFPLLSLFSHLRSRGVDVEVLDLEIEFGRVDSSNLADYSKRARELLAAPDFDIAAISCYTTFDFTGALETARLCRETHPDCEIATGGYHPSGLPADFRGAGSPFDVLISGEAEIALEELAGGTHERTPGQARIIQGKPLELTDDYRLEWEAYPYSHLSPPVQNMVLSRGCPFACSYCAEPWAKNGRWRSFSVQKSLRLLDELFAVIKPSSIQFSDPMFGFQSSWRKEFLAGLAARNFPAVFNCQTRVDALDGKDLELISRLPLLVFLGMESASPSMLQVMHKTENPTRYLRSLSELLSRASDIDAALHTNLLFNHPGETPETFKETVRFMEDFAGSRAANSISTVGFHYRFFPTCDDYAELKGFEARFGTKVLFKEWWKSGPDEMDLQSRSIIASRETEAAFGASSEYWHADYERMRRRLVAGWSQKIRHCLAAHAAAGAESHSLAAKFRADAVAVRG